MNEPESRPSLWRADNLAPLATLGELGLAVLALGIGWWCQVAPGASLAPDRFSAAQRGMSAGIGLAACVPPLIFLWLVSRTNWPPLANLRSLVETQIVPWFATTSNVEFAVLSLAAGLSEELLFRGLMQQGLADWWGAPWGVWFGVIVASVVFGLGHALSRAYFVLATVMGIYLGVLYVGTGDLLAPIVTHAGYDFVALLWLVRRREK